MSCIFCGEKADSNHHLLPKAVRKEMKWDGQRARRLLGQYKVPMCTKCHRKLNKIQEPLINIIKHLRGVISLPMEFMYLMNGVYEELVPELEASTT